MSRTLRLMLVEDGVPVDGAGVPSSPSDAGEPLGRGVDQIVITGSEVHVIARMVLNGISALTSNALVELEGPPGVTEKASPRAERVDLHSSASKLPNGPRPDWPSECRMKLSLGGSEPRIEVHPRLLSSWSDYRREQFEAGVRVLLGDSHLPVLRLLMRLGRVSPRYLSEWEPDWWVARSGDPDRINRFLTKRFRDTGLRPAFGEDIQSPGSGPRMMLPPSIVKTTRKWEHFKDHASRTVSYEVVAPHDVFWCDLGEAHSLYHKAHRGFLVEGKTTFQPGEARSMKDQLERAVALDRGHANAWILGMALAVHQGDDEWKSSLMTRAIETWGPDDSVTAAITRLWKTPRHLVQPGVGALLRAIPPIVSTL